MASRLPIFQSQHLEALCKVLAHTERGLTGTQIGRILTELQIADCSPDLTKWKRLFNALAEMQNKHHVGNHVIQFINRAMDPVAHTADRNAFDWLRTELNVTLAFSGYEVREDGRVRVVSRAETLSEALQRAGRLRSQLASRRAHDEVIKYIRAELLGDDAFHAVLEAAKGLGERIRILSGLTQDGAELVQTAFSPNRPVLAFNSLATETEKSEQKGLMNLLIGVFGAFRNPPAHAPKIHWFIPEDDAADMLTLMSFLHRKLDRVRKV